ncbi:hypothetical protein BU23DRAFT_513872 [Bimuria novae-zelandiae CBS 107.79]|uniref:Transcription initiation factor TFIID subunit 2 n=1 Tax=Bimuria novae-zelandiae CBS 107.79 TaxID=1447943 RepID=A0A6A5UYM4_9PLEO|nr:hypothetical protein BU23DRAFT_513872 [Bimuria novae-zelandiae CBS 107.79]
MDVDDDPALISAFTVESQRLELDFSFCPRFVKGKTTITIQPQSPKLREIHLSCRQLKPTRVHLLHRDVAFEYNDEYDYLGLDRLQTIHQHHFLRNRVGRHELQIEEELKIPIPPELKIPTRRQQNGQELMCDPFTVEIEYTLDDFRDGLHFVGTGEGDSRYPHVYTRNTIVPLFASSWFPCVDDGTTRIPFELSVRYPRTVADALAKRPVSDNRAQTYGVTKADSVLDGGHEDNDLSDEERALEMRAVCSGELTDTINDPKDPSRTTSIFRIDPITGGGILPQHVGLTIGPFQEVDLARFRAESEGDRLQDQAVRVHAFCLPGREEELANSTMMIPRVMDSFVDCYQTFRLGKSYELVFVDDLPFDTAHTMALTICSSRLLYPGNVWEPLEHTTRTLVHAVASQWIGVDVIHQDSRDYWVIAGASWFMTEFYLRDLFGRNDHRFRQKMAMEQLLRLDVRRPSLHELGRLIHVDPGAEEFLHLKSLAVLSILHNRLVRTSGKNGVDRCLYRLLLNRAGGSLNNGAISTDGFLSLCEKVGHQKLDSFFNQWVYGSGYPVFECQPSFNKKRQSVNLTIRQMQSGPTVDGVHDAALNSSDFMREAKERSRGFQPKQDMPAFVGPMTIRIHEADGTPYEHIIEINSSNVRVEIPYNTKYKRIKRNKLNKERQAQAQGGDVGGDQDEVTIYSLGDLFLNTEEAEEWRIHDWSANDERDMESEAYEYIRIDADFEWLAQININGMRSYMFISQLQQDKDVVAQAESIQWLAKKEGHGIISGFLVKTLMDERYFHGIRTMAADVLANQYIKDPEDPFLGLFHLIKAFKRLFYDSSSDMTRPNDFMNRALYKIQCAIPLAISKVKGPDGRAPPKVKQFLLDIVRHNDNRGNKFSDDYYLSTLMRGLANSLIDLVPATASSFEYFPSAEEMALRRKAIGEIDRHKRLDEWIPSHNNVFTITALDCDVRLMVNRLKPLKLSEFLFYSQPGNAENVRLKAWDCLVRLGAFYRKDSVTKYMIHELYADPSPYFRVQLLRILGVAIGKVAVGDPVTLDELRKKETTDGVFEFGNENVEAEARKDKQDRFQLEGAFKALKKELGKNEALKNAVEDALKANASSLQIVSELLDICDMFVDHVNRLIVTLKYPRYWAVERVLPRGQQLGTVPLRFYRTEKIRTKILRPLQLPAPPAVDTPAPTTAPAPILIPTTVPAPEVKVPKIALKLGFGSKKVAADGQNPAGRLGSESVPGTPVPEATAVASQEHLRNLPGPTQQSSTTLGGTATPIGTGSKASTPAPSLPSQAPSPAPPKPQDTSTPMEGVEFTETPPPPRPQPAPISVPAPATVPVPAPVPISRPASAAPTPTPPRTPIILEPKAPKLKFKTKSGASASASKVARPSPLPSQQPKEKKSKRIILRLPSDKLASLGKRKAQSDIDPRPLKRQSTEPAGMVRSHIPAAGGGETKGFVTWERKGGEKPRLMVKMKLSRSKLAKATRIT